MEKAETFFIECPKAINVMKKFVFRDIKPMITNYQNKLLEYLEGMTKNQILRLYTSTVVEQFYSLQPRGGQRL
jgi:hypothetical protein